MLVGLATVSQGRQDAGRQFGLPRSLPRSPGAVRIATYNVENLFDHADDPDLGGEFDDADLGISDARARAIAEAVRAADADILAVEEIESLDALRWFRDTYLSDLGYGHLMARDVGYYRGVEQGVLSRFPIIDFEVRPNASLADVQRKGDGWADMPTSTREQMTVQRSPLRVTVRINESYSLTLFIIHHKSGDFAWKREGEALKTLEWLSEFSKSDPSANIVLLGDFNCAPWDKSLRAYLEAGFIDIMHFRTITGEEGPRYKSHRSDRVIDYILMNAPAYNEYIPGSAHILGTYNPPDSWDWRTEPYPAGYASDHFPVIAEIHPANRN